MIPFSRGKKAVDGNDSFGVHGRFSFGVSKGGKGPSFHNIFFGIVVLVLFGFWIYLIIHRIKELGF